MDQLKVLITGTTGMVGKGVLLECLENPAVSAIIIINRHSAAISHPKLKEIIHNDFYNLSAIESQLTGIDACFFCLGVSAFRMNEAVYTRITYDLTISVARALLRLNPGMAFCYVSGEGTDSSEKGGLMWARVKGKTENTLLSMPFNKAYMFRPGYIHPMFGVKSRTAWYNAIYVVFKPLYPILKALFPNRITTNQAVGKAMIAVALQKPPLKVLTPKDINDFAASLKS